jgi:iron complex outermembrane recepter protein
VRPFAFSDHSADNAPTQVTVQGVNIASINTTGLDIESSYRSQIFNNPLTIRLYINHVFSFETQQAAGQPFVEYAGYDNTQGTGLGGGTSAIPSWKAAGTVSYGLGNWSMNLQENFIGPMKLGPQLVYRDNHLSSFATTDFTVAYRPATLGMNAEVFAAVTNLFDKTPPIDDTTVAPGLGLSTIAGLYDTTGRAFLAGIRARF